MASDHHTGTDLYTALLELTTPQEFERFFKDICTPQEITAMQERWRVCQLLEQGTNSYRDIHAITGASLTTITRVARFLKDEPYNGYKTVLQRLKRKIKHE